MPRRNGLPADSRGRNSHTETRAESTQPSRADSAAERTEQPVARPGSASGLGSRAACRLRLAAGRREAGVTVVRPVADAADHGRPPRRPRNGRQRLRRRRARLRSGRPRKGSAHPTRVGARGCMSAASQGAVCDPAYHGCRQVDRRSGARWRRQRQRDARRLRDARRARREHRDHARRHEEGQEERKRRPQREAPVHI